MQIDREAIADFALKTIVAIGLVSLALLVWKLRDAVLLVFAAVITAVILRAFARALQRVVPMGDGIALSLATVIIAVVVIGAVGLFGQEVSTQISALANMLPGAWDTLVDTVGAERLDQLVDRFMPEGATIASIAQSVISVVVSAASGLALAVLGGIYLALSPDTYRRRGALRLLPASAQRRATRAVDQTGDSLRAWLIGQILLMLLVGVVTGVGLSVIGVPSAFALGLIAGLLEFVPLIGPIAAAIPGVLIALTMGIETAALTAGFYLVVQQSEGNILEPLVMRKSVSIPPAITLFAIFLFGALFGPLGVLLGGPLTVAAFVMVRVLWLNDDLSGGRQAKASDPAADGAA